MKPILILACWIGVVVCTPSWANEEFELAQQLWQSHQNHQLMPLVSSSHPHLSLKQAYWIQKHYVTAHLKQDEIAGFKAGLTSEAGQKKFHLTQPVVGVLFSSGQKNPKETIQKTLFNRLMLETEIGFEVGQAITQLISDKTELKRYIKSIFPVIELPDLGFVNQPKSIDIIATNVGAAAFIKGQPMTSLTDLDLNALSVTLMREDEVIQVGQGSDPFGDQWSAALWLVNTLVAQDWRLKPGQFLITGALGSMIEPQPGTYQADFGKLGKISFSIAP